jgi:hypothetical protein
LHERGVLCECELRRDEREASGDEKRKSDHLSKKRRSKERERLVLVREQVAVTVSVSGVGVVW